MIIGVGTDILSLARLQAFSPSRLVRLSRRILTERERDDLHIHTQKSEHVEDDAFSKAQLERMSRFLGVRWAAKEAIYKALYPSHRATWKDIEVLPLQYRVSDANSTPQDSHSKAAMPLSDKLVASFTKLPRITYRDSTLTSLNVHLSISHDAGIVVAMALIEGE